MHGAIFSFKGNAPNDSNAISVNTDDGSLRLTLSVSSGSYGGGGVAFESGCLNASAFTGVQFTVAVASGSLTGCSYQLQLQTFEQRPTSQSPPGGCDILTTSCYGFPAATDLPTPSTDITMPTLVSIPFGSFVGVGDARARADRRPAVAGQLVERRLHRASCASTTSLSSRRLRRPSRPTATPAMPTPPTPARSPRRAALSVDQLRKRREC